MVIVKMIHGFGGLSKLCARIAIEVDPMIEVCCAASAPILEKNVKAVFGDQSKLPGLAQATQDARTALGFSPADPLLRDASLLRDHIESAHTATTASVGSSEPVQLYSETGFVSIRSGVSVPPRKTLRIGVLESEHEVVAVFEAGVGLLLR
jgi:hypothetical protein